MTGRWKARFVLATLAGLAACASAGRAPDGLGPTPHLVTALAVLPAIPAVDGPLRIDVVYPPDSAAITARDSTFIFGSTGSGRAALSINGAPVRVAPNGAFLAFLPVPADGVYRIRATRDVETASLDHTVVAPQPPSVPDSGATILVESIEPRGGIAWPAASRSWFRFLGTAGGLASVQSGTANGVDDRAPLAGGPGRDAANFQRVPGQASPRRPVFPNTPVRCPRRNGSPPTAAQRAALAPPCAAPHPGRATPAVRLVVNADTALAPVPVAAART